eukprot:1923072-Karenia_brevis.AAC.1
MKSRTTAPTIPFSIPAGAHEHQWLASSKWKRPQLQTSAIVVAIGISSIGASGRAFRPPASNPTDTQPTG